MIDTTKLIPRRSKTSALSPNSLINLNVIKVTTDSTANLIKISTDAQDIGAGYESLPVSFKGESFQIAFNVRYLLDGLKVIDSNLIKLSCNSPTTPAVFSPINSDVNFIYLVMPIQIRN